MCFFRALLIASDPINPSQKHGYLAIFWQKPSYAIYSGSNSLLNYTKRNPGEPVGAGDGDPCFQHFSQGGVARLGVERLELGHIVAA